MTPLEIEILLHYATRCSDYRDGDFSAPAVDEAIKKFMQFGLLSNEPPDGMLNTRPQKVWPNYEALEQYVHVLCAVPLPQKRWTMPDHIPMKPIVDDMAYSRFDPKANDGPKGSHWCGW